jgi:LysR family transcriptional regulator, carnitine catabolism transcriptional activator
VIRDFAVARETIHDALGLRSGRIDICAVPAATAGWLAPMITEFRRAHSGIDISVRAEIDSQRITEEVRSGRCAFGLAVAATKEDGLVTREVGFQELQAIFPPGTAGVGEPIGVGELARLDLVTVHRGLSTSRRWFEAELGWRGERPRIALELGSMESVLPLVTEGAGYALWWTPVSASMIGSCVLRPIRPGTRRPVILVRRTGPLTPATTAFLEVAGVQAG